MSGMHTGFTNYEGPCCGGYVPPFFCYQGLGWEICEDRNTYVFWDAYHPTEASNRIVADRMLNGNKSDCWPLNIRELYYHLLG